MAFRSERRAIILRCVDTERSLVKKVLSAESPTKGVDTEIINDLGGKIIDWVKADFPLRGKIISISGNKCQVNLGHFHGLKKGDMLSVLDAASERPGMQTVKGELEITDVEENMSWGSFINTTGTVKEGDKVLEKQKGV